MVISFLLPMLLLLTFLSIIVLVLLIVGLKLDTFISFLLVSISLGLATGMPVAKISEAVQKGVGSTLGDLVLIVGFGAMLGKLVADSGAAQRITDALIGLFGKKYIQWGMAISGFIIGIPLFYSAGFVIVIPIIFMISATAGLPSLYVGIPMLCALSVAHGYLPPHPSPTAIVAQLQADMSKTLLYGIVVSIPAIVCAGPLFAGTLRKFDTKVNTSLFSLKPRPAEELPGLTVSVVTALLPVFLLTFMSWLKSLTLSDSLPAVRTTLHLLAEPWFGMLISVLFASYTLGIRRGLSMTQVTKSFEEAFKSIAVILLIIAGAGVFKQMMTESGINAYLAENLKNVDISPLVLAWGTSAIIRVCVGSATVAGLTTVGILGPMIMSSGVSPELAVLAIGAGSLMFSHVNDGAFWLFKEYFNVTLKETLLTWSMMETIVSIVGLLGVLVLQAII